MAKSFTRQIYGRKLRIVLRCFTCGGTNNVATFGKMDWCRKCAKQAQARGGLK